MLIFSILKILIKTSCKKSQTAFTEKINQQLIDVGKGQTKQRTKAGRFQTFRPLKS